MSLSQQSRAVLAHHARSFRWAAAFLPSNTHDDAALLYAFCRAVDDAADENETREAAVADLTHLREALAGKTENALIEQVRETILDERPCLHAAEDLLVGVEGDLDAVRIANDVELIRYAYRVAGTVGVMMCRVLGVSDPEALPHAIDLGIAMQLTNICRDVLEDAQRGRVYLPADRLVAAGTSPEALLDGSANPEAVAAVVRDLLLLAETFYASADAGLRYIPARPRLAILIASRLYRAIGLRLLDRGGNALAGRTVVSWWSKVGWVVRSLFEWPFIGLRKRFARPHERALHQPLSENTSAGWG